MCSQTDLYLRALHLRHLRWGAVDGPTAYSDLPCPLDTLARQIDRIGEALALFRLSLAQTDLPADSPVLSVQVLANVLAETVVAVGRVPDPAVPWTIEDLAPSTFDAAALNGAFYCLALGGEPNTWLAERPGILPATADLRALQLVAKALVDTVEGTDQSPVLLLQDFVRMHWKNTDGDVGLELGWEEHPLGIEIFSAVRATKHLPADDAHVPVSAPASEDFAP